MFGKRKRAIALDIGTSEIKALEVEETRTGLAITGFAATPVGGEADTKFAVKQLIRHAKFKTRNCITAVAGRGVIVRYVNMAQMSKDELRQVIRFEADKYIPFEVEEVVLDEQILEENVGGGEGDKPEMKVLLVAVRKGMIEDHLAMLQDAGLTSTVIDVDAFALGNAFEAQTLARGNVNPERVVALIDIGANKTNINIMRGTVSYFTREVYLAGNDFTDAVSRRFSLDTPEAERLKCDPQNRAGEVEEAILPTLDDLGNEIQLSFDYFENQFDRVVEEVYISGGSARLPGLERAFEGAFEKKVLFWNPLDGLEIRDLDTKVLNNFSGQLAVAIGLATRIRKW